MKLQDISKTVDDNQKESGTYAGIRFSKKTVDALLAFAKEHKIPKLESGDELHTTLLYSRKHLPNYKPAGKYDQPMIGTAIEWDVWKSQPKEDGSTKNILVLVYSCPELYQHHHKLMAQHGATYDFDNYQPHVSLSYDVGDFDFKKLPAFEDELEIVSEYYEELS